MRRLVLALAAVFLMSDTALAGDRLAERQADLNVAREKYVARSIAFSDVERRQALDYIEELRPRVGAMSDIEFLVAAMRIPAFAQNAHDDFSVGKGWSPEPRLPVRFIWFPDGLTVARAGPEHADLLGARLTAVDGVSPKVLLKRLREYSGGEPAFVSWDAAWAYERLSMLHAMGIARSPERATFEFLLPDGRRIRRALSDAPREQAPGGVPAPRIWSSDPFAKEADLGWRAANTGAAQPLYLRDAELPFRMVTAPELDALYVQFRTNVNRDGHSIDSFVAQVKQELTANPPRNLILDLRFDTGGDSTRTRALMKAIAEQVRGRIFVLTSRYTFSAGIVMTAAVKHDAGPRVTLVGEPVGDNLRFESEGLNTCLPNSKYCMRWSNGRWDLARGCKDEKACYGDAFDARVESLRPDIKAPITAKAWLAGRDPGLEAVARALGRQVDVAAR